MDKKISFDEAYKQWRNKARRYSIRSIILLTMELLHRPAADRLEALKHAPWQMLLLLKWVCQDRLASFSGSRDIQVSELDDLRQSIWSLPEKVDLRTSETLPGLLLFRQIARPQVDFQRPMTLGFVREAALLSTQPTNSSLRRAFEARTGLAIETFLDLAYATYTAIVAHGNLSQGWFDPLRSSLSGKDIDSFISSVSVDPRGLVAFFRSLPSDKRVTSELYEFPLVKRFPLLQHGGRLLCWHPAVFYRGMEGFVHSILSEEGESYMRNFSSLFERHVVQEAKSLPATFYGEAEMAAWLPGQKIPDGLLSYPGANVFIEAKSGLFDESVMTVGHSGAFKSKTGMLIKAVTQAWSASDGVRSTGSAPENVRDADRDYLLVVTNKELGAGRGDRLAAMYPADAFKPTGAVCEDKLPLKRVYVLSIEDFERLAAGVRSTGQPLPDILESCVTADEDPRTSVFYFEQHLDRLGLPMAYSQVVETAEAASRARLEAAMMKSSSPRGVAGKPSVFY